MNGKKGKRVGEDSRQKSANDGALLLLEDVKISVRKKKKIKDPALKKKKKTKAV